MTRRRYASGYSPGFWGTHIAKLAQGRVLKWCPRSSRGLKKKNVWFRADLLVASILVTKQQPRHHTRGLAASPALHRGPCTSILSDWLQNRVRQGRNSLAGLKGAGGSISGGGGGVHCQQQ